MDGVQLAHEQLSCACRFADLQGIILMRVLPPMISMVSIKLLLLLLLRLLLLLLLLLRLLLLLLLLLFLLLVLLLQLLFLVLFRMFTILHTCAHIVVFQILLPSMHAGRGGF